MGEKFVMLASRTFWVMCGAILLMCGLFSVGASIGQDSQISIPQDSRGNVIRSGVGDAAAHQIKGWILEWLPRGASATVAFRTLDGKAKYFYDGDLPFPAAGTIRLPVMIELFRQVHEGRLQLADPLFVHNEFYSVFDSSRFQLYPEEDSETDLYKAEGQTRTIGEICELMIRANSKLATNLLIRKLELENIQATVHSLNADNVHIVRSFGDDEALTDEHLNNFMTARALQELMTAIAEDKAVGQDSSAAMVEMLEHQHLNEGISAGVRPETRVAHQTGQVPNIKLYIDAAIVYAPRPFVLVIRTLQIPEKDCATLMADITRILYQAVE